MDELHYFPFGKVFAELGAGDRKFPVRESPSLKVSPNAARRPRMSSLEGGGGNLDRDPVRSRAGHQHPAGGGPAARRARKVPAATGCRDAAPSPSIDDAIRRAFPQATARVSGPGLSRPAAIPGFRGGSGVRSPGFPAAFSGPPSRRRAGHVMVAAELGKRGVRSKVRDVGERRPDGAIDIRTTPPPPFLDQFPSSKPENGRALPRHGGVLHWFQGYPIHRCCSRPVQHTLGPNG